MEVEVKHKEHRKRQAGPKSAKKKQKKKEGKDEEQKNPKAFTYHSAVRAGKSIRRTLDLKEKRHHIPVMDRTPLEPPPVLVAVVGPPKVGKSTLIAGLVKHFTHQTLSDDKCGPITVVSGKKRRLTFIECNNDINCMIDIAKIADLVLLLVDASFGFEMETFEFLNILQVHGFPRVMGVLTHLDMMKNNKNMKKTKKKLKQRFWTEIYQGAKLFYLSTMNHGQYLKHELHNLGRFISVMKFRPLEWRSGHPYILADRMEHITPPEDVRVNPHCDRIISLYGYMHGVGLKPNSKVHIPGCGDFPINDLSVLPDPCPLPDKEKKRSLSQRERLIYAPMAGIGGIVYDKDAVYIELGGSHSMMNKTQSNEFVANMMSSETTLDDRMKYSKLSLIRGADPLPCEPTRRKVVFSSSEGNDDNGSDGDGEESSEDEEEEQKKKLVIKSGRHIDISEEEEEDMKLLAGTRQKARKSKKQVPISSECGDPEDADGENSDEKSDIVGFFDLEAEEDNEMIYEDEEDEMSDSENGEDSDLVITEARDRSRKRGSVSDSDNSEETDGKETGSDGEKTGSNEEEMGTDGDILPSHLRWKSDLAHKANKTFKQRYSRSTSLKMLVYGDTKRMKNKESKEYVGGLFHVRGSVSTENYYNQLDTSLCTRDIERDWCDDSVICAVKSRFVTGSWGDEDASRLLEEDEEMYGDFEDLETGEIHKVTQEEDEQTEDNRKKKKIELKKAFNKEYDDENDESTFYDELKQQLSEQAELNRKEFESLDDNQRLTYEGARSGTYVRLELKGIPFEFLHFFDPSYPIIVGGLLSGEDKLGYNKVRLKHHRWHKRILKSFDPLIVSVGWRRFQTIVVYSTEDHNGRQRMIKYTPQHMHCTARYYGPVTPPSTGILGVQSVKGLSDFRIAATGVVMEMEKSTNIVKKLKLIGTPYKIFKHTAFIRGMFSTTLECAKFEGAFIRTVSGIRGQIKKTLSSPEGAFRATFEDRILASDIVFVPTWYPVEIPRYYNPVASLLYHDKLEWEGMRTVGQLRKDLGMKPPLKTDSLYKPVERPVKKFNPLKIPRALEKDLPFKSRPKYLAKRKKKGLLQKQAVVLEPQEKKVRNMMQQLLTLHKEKVRKQKMKHRVEQSKYQERKRREEDKQQQHTRLLRKRFYQEMGVAEKRKEKRVKTE